MYVLLWGCSDKKALDPNFLLHDPGLEIDLIAAEPEIVTPIGITFDTEDAIYVLESHTHSPLKDYEGPAFDRVKKGIDRDGDGKPDHWYIYADSLEDGMNLTFREGLFVSTKKGIYFLPDTNQDHRSDRRLVLAEMVQPENVYDHAGILGLTIGPDGLVYFTRGNTGSHKWKIVGSDGSSLTGYGDGGNVMRCAVDGSQLEEIATGFWNPFDLRFTKDGRLLLTDNDPDSRGPNRLIDIVPGGHYGYESLYGGSGIHPYLSWNGELPGTLPYAAPLGEAPCSLWDGASTGLGESYAGDILVNIWEENRIVHIPLRPTGSSISGEPRILVQGGKDFHPVDFATNSRGELYLTDWVMRRYPNHGKGKIWRIRARRGSPSLPTSSEKNKAVFSHFISQDNTDSTLISLLETGDPFQKSWARRALGRHRNKGPIKRLMEHEQSELRLQGLLIALHSGFEIPHQRLKTLVADPKPPIRQMAMVYAGKMGRVDILETLYQLMHSGEIGPKAIETYLATLRHLQKEFIQAHESQTVERSKDLPRKLPAGYLIELVMDPSVPDEVRALCLPYLNQGDLDVSKLLKQTSNPSFQIGLIKYLKRENIPQKEQQFIELAKNQTFQSEVRSQALLSLPPLDTLAQKELIPIFKEKDSLLSYALVKFLCSCEAQTVHLQEVDRGYAIPEAEYLQELWQNCSKKAGNVPGLRKEYPIAEKNRGNAQRGRLVYESSDSQCGNCHKIHGWGGSLGPDLSHVGASKSIAQLREAIINPSAEIAPEWQTWYVVDSAGVRHQGRQIDIHLHRVELMNLTGGFDSFAQPQDYGLASQSLMPDGLELGLSLGEFEDLISYLASLQ